MTNEELWKAVLGQVELSISRAGFRTWFQNTYILSKEDGVVVISVPNGFAKEWLENKYNLIILQAFKSFDAVIKEIRCIISGPQQSGNTIKSIDAVRQADTSIQNHQLSQEKTIVTIQQQTTPLQTTALFHE